MEKIISTIKKALVYCRVSSERQVKEGNGLDSQEKRGRDYAKNKGYLVIKVFKDEGISGGKSDRPAINDLVKFLDDNPLDEFVVIIDDLSRLARDVAVYIQLKTALTSRGVVLECPNFNFEDSPESEFAEMVMASANQLHRKQNKRQVIQKQKARLELGYWCFCQPKGYRYIKHSTHKKLLTANEPYASIFKEALEKYSTDYLNTLDETKEFVLKKYREYKIKDTISIRGIEDTLKNVLYAGYVEYLPWKVERRKGHHKALISLDTFNRNQLKLAGRSRKRLRADYSEDFPLRGLVVCDNCGKPFTASWNTGRSGRYPNYWCKTMDCKYRYKSVSKGKIEPSFEHLIRDAPIDEDILGLAEIVFKDVWENKIENYRNEQENLNIQLEQIDGRISNLIQLASNAKSYTLVATYEKEIEKLNKQREDICTGLKDSNFSVEQFGTARDSVFHVLKNPLALWKTEELENKRTVTQMYFADEIRYDYFQEFGTASFCDEINTIRSLTPAKVSLVEMGGVEPPS